MVKKGDQAGIFVHKMIEFLESLGFSIELTVMDKEYYQKWIFKYLDGKDITHIVPVRESEKLKGIKETALKDPKDRVQTYGMKDGYVKGKGYQQNKFKKSLFYNISCCNLRKCHSRIRVLFRSKFNNKR